MMKDTSVPLNYYTVFRHIQDNIPKGRDCILHIILIVTNNDVLKTHNNCIKKCSTIQKKKKNAFYAQKHDQKMT